MRLALVCGFALPWLLAAPSRAQEGARVEHHSRAQMREGVAAATRAPDGLAVLPLGSRGSYSYLVVSRDRTGDAEVHDAWDDVIVVQEGSATLLHGGALVGGRQTAPGEVRGGEIRGGVTRPVAAGDFVMVPAGVPHQMRVAEGQSVTYLIVKARPEGPPARP